MIKYFALFLFFTFFSWSSVQIEDLAYFLCNKKSFNKSEFNKVIQYINENDLDLIYHKFGDVFLHDVSSLDTSYLRKILFKVESKKAKLLTVKKILQNRFFNKHTIGFLNLIALEYPVYDLFVNLEDFKLLSRDAQGKQIRFAILKKSPLVKNILDIALFKVSRSFHDFEYFYNIGNFDSFSLIKDIGVNDVFDFLIVKELKDRKDFKSVLKAIFSVRNPSLVDGDMWFDVLMYIGREVFFSAEFDLSEKRDLLLFFDSIKFISKSNLVDMSWFLGFVKLEIFNDDDANRFFEENIARTNSAITKAKNLYWLGRYFKKNNLDSSYTQTLESASEYGLTYYGQLASDELNFDLKSQILKQKIYNYIDTSDDLFLQLAFYTYNIGCKGVSQDLFYTYLESDVSGDHKISVVKDVYDLDKYFGNLFGRFITRFNIFLDYVSYQKSEYTKKSIENAIIRQESQFNASVSDSHKGAAGLMQIMPDTARYVCKKNNINFNLNKLRKDPKYSVKIGRMYYDGLEGSFNGQKHLSVAAYNAGPTVVRKWVESFKNNFEDKDEVFFIETIPYSETRNYIMRVTEAHNVYNALYD